ncbi:hypothetical protein M8C13_20440 [Crossiella sp. SN42]|uniref:hypothetical protein n=1 Tax=Crossiella sp. SN42 TaxID=2944808 RepID=UPI00207C2ACA|nr:hypothetical protein [Crossiella sp. SN42]MCO1578124.1 hypothetical protein [Crossiella sp. SN42]
MKKLMIIGTPAHPSTGEFGPSGHGINGNGVFKGAGFCVNARVGLAARRYAQIQGTSVFAAWTPATVTTLIPAAVDVPNTDERRMSALERSP